VVNRAIEQVSKKLRADHTQVSPISAASFQIMIEAMVGFQFHSIAADPNEASVLTILQQALLAASANEHLLIAHITPILAQLCAECGLVFVNSEELPWVKGYDCEALHQLHKPSGFSCLPGLYDPHGPTSAYNNNVAAARAQYPDNQYLFGKGIWRIKDHYHVLWEIKVRIEPRDRGAAYKYAVEMSFNDPFNIYVVVLGDPDGFLVVEAVNGTVQRRVLRGSWTAGGSRKFLLQLLQRMNHWSVLLRLAIGRFQMESVICFLGAGGMGRCYRCRIDGGEERAIKTVLTVAGQASSDAAILTRLEFQLLCRVNQVAHQHSVGVDAASWTSFSIPDRVGEPLGIAYSMTDVGEPMDRKNTTRCMHYMLQLLQSLEALHAAGYCHGDAHVENAVIVNGRVKWVDFMTAMSDVNATDMSRRNDMRKLLESVYGDTILENTAVQLAIGNYPTPGTAQNICDSLPIAQTHT
jgi:hypothetical protein